MFISTKDLVKKYGKGDAEIYAIDHISMEIEQGEMTVILGPSGSGKSTLLNLLGGLDQPDSGSIIINGQNLPEMNQKKLSDFRRNQIGFVFQSYNLTPDLSVLENVQMTAELIENPLSAEELVRELGLEQHQYKFPNTLSGEQQQRVAIARAMVKKPALLLCDELTGALDSKSSLDVLRKVDEMNRKYGTTVIIITHNEVISQMADRIIRLKDGKLVSDTLNTCKVSADQLNI